MTATAKVLNGEVKEGDKIAYSTRAGSYQDMTIGEVTAVASQPDWPYPVLKVRPGETSGYRVTSRVVTLTALDRVVKLGTVEGAAPGDTVLSEFVDWLTGFQGEMQELYDGVKNTGLKDVRIAASGGLAMILMCLEKLDELAAAHPEAARG